MSQRGIILFLLTVIQIIEMTVEARPNRSPCIPCPIEGCSNPPLDCPYGTITDPCGRSSCAKGPGDSCKIKRFRMQGDCGDGMYCHCGVCMGCSLHTYSCFEFTCVVPIG